MGKGVFITFFVVATFVIIFFRYAKAGISAASSAANQNYITFSRQTQSNPPLDKAMEKASIIASALDFQRSIGKIGPDAERNFLLRQNDDFSIGYVFGFVDGISQSSKMALDDEAYQIMIAVFFILFGREASARLLDRAASLQEQSNGLFFDGRAKGGNEAFAWAKSDGKNTPKEWAKYLRGYP